jgi:hypothetical protein
VNLYTILHYAARVYFYTLYRVYEISRIHAWSLYTIPVFIPLKCGFIIVQASLTLFRDNYYTGSTQLQHYISGLHDIVHE